MSRRVWVVCLGLCLVAFLVDGAVHSVHHLDSDSEATTCWFTSIAGDLSIVHPDATVLDGFRTEVVGRAVDAVWSAPAEPPLGVSCERAPPARLSA